MQFSTMAHVLGLLGVTPARAFLPAFLTALVIRIGGIPYLTDAAASDVEIAPSWFTHTYTLIILGLLSLLEIVATKSPEVRQALSLVDRYYKPALAALTSFGVISTANATAVESLHGTLVITSLAPFAAISFCGVTLSFIVWAITTGGTFFLCVLRAELCELLEDIDADDSMGIQSLISWAEDAWVAVLVVMLVLVPILILSLVMVLLFGLWLMRKYLERRAEQSKVLCPKCRTRIFPFATVCSNCKVRIRPIAGIGFLGQSRVNSEVGKDRTGHRLQLIALKRCPDCASRLKGKTLVQTCEVCTHDLASGDRLPDSYLDMVHARLPQALLICGLCGLVPIAGMIPAIVYYRVVLVSPFRTYIGLGSCFVSRWLARFAGFMLLAFFAWVPFLSILVPPSLAYMNYLIYRRAFLRQWERELPIGIVISDG